MACFLVPAAEAIVATVIQKTVGKEKAEKMKLEWLNTMLWGGVIVLAIEHIWHGEVVPWPPFLTAMADPADVAPMLHEMATIGGSMALIITLTWIVMVLVANALSAKAPSKKASGA
ncbi:MAG TPA: hypothetical protein PK718_06200 [Candidatus Methanofastidiosa archaeon]|nr:hypothetical protein [Candidatus Methanofastidiosa archaeon]HPR42123.1 hypothetical protein [Candidatus Methanofastidiosa archaeon]